MALQQTLQDAPQPVISPTALNARRQIALAMLQQGNNYSPIASPWQGVARVTNAIMGGLAERRLEQQEMTGRQMAANATGDLLSKAFGGAGLFPPAPSAGSDAGQPTPSGPSPTADAGGPTGPMSKYANAIASIESDGSGGYGALGPTTKSGDRAYGRYQVMGNNVPEWTQAALGHAMTPQQFLADPKAQDAVFANQFGGYVQKYGNPQDAASAWFTGQPLSTGGNRSDILGTTGNAYVDKFNRALGSPAVAAVSAEAGGVPTQVASLDPGAGMPAPTPDPGIQATPPANLGNPDPGMAVAPPTSAINPDPGIQVGGAVPPSSMPTPAQSQGPQGLPQVAQSGSILPTSDTPMTGAQKVAAATAAPAPQDNLPVMAGGSSDAIGGSGATNGGINGMSPNNVAAIVAAMSNPWASEGQQQLLGGVLASRLTPHKMIPIQTGQGTLMVDELTGQQRGFIPTANNQVIEGPGGIRTIVNTNDPNSVATYNQHSGATPAYRFMTQEEKAANGLPLDTPIQIDPAGKMVTNGVTVNTGTPQSQYSDEMAKGLSGPHMALEGGVEQAQEQLRDVHAMQAAVQQVQQNGGTTGMGQPEIMKLQSAINTGANVLGIDQPFDISDKEFLSKFNRQIAGAQAKSAAGARVTNFELKNYLQANPGLEMSPQGNERLLGIQSQMLQRNIDVGQAIRTATANAVSQGKKVNPAQIEQIIRDYDEQHHITDPITGQDLTQDVKLKDLGQAAPNGAPTQSPSGRPRATNPKTGQSVEWDGAQWVPAQ